MGWQLPVGARPEADGVLFRVWAPDSSAVDVVLYDEKGASRATYPLQPEESAGYFSGRVKGIGEGARYMYRLNGERTRPDPASRFQPEGVHGPSQVVDPAFEWTATGWNGLPLSRAVIYELHVGTATPGGTFDSLIEKLPYVKSLGVTALELLPVADFPGRRNWGYDGVDLFAPSRAYGGPVALKRLVDAAHREGLAIVLDVVYNHLGPDGNYLRDFAREYFASGTTTPWGEAPNFASRHVRDFFIWNALYWAHEYNVDGLRLDATHIIVDNSPAHILRELPSRVKESLREGREFLVFAEDDRNEVWLITPAEDGGAGMDAVWADDFHHQVRSAVAGDNEGYYMDFTGSAADLAATLRAGWFYSGQWSQFRGAPRGTGPAKADPARFLFSIQNHDQVGNRAVGDRLPQSAGMAAYRAASALLLLSPYTPLIFAGQEWAASTPFLFFTDHSLELGRQVTEGRRREFAGFSEFHGKEVPDPQSEETFLASRLKWQEQRKGRHARTLALYRELLALRATLPALHECPRAGFTSDAVGENAVALRYISREPQSSLLLLANLKGNLRLDLAASEPARLPAGLSWKALLSTEEPRFGGSQRLEDLQAMLYEGVLAASGPVAWVLGAAGASPDGVESAHG